MKVLICGSRTWENVDEIKQWLRRYEKDTEIIVGGARGADSIAESCARELGLKVSVFLAEWHRYGRRAGAIRNLNMLDQKPDFVVAFRVVGESPGTDQCVREARRRRIPVQVIQITETG
jgi:hypothetical protein